MITAKEAYENYMANRSLSQTQRFVNSVLHEVITEKSILSKSMNEKEINFSLSTIFSKIFLSENINGFPAYTGWKLYFEDLPCDLYGKYNREIVSDLRGLFSEANEQVFICKAFKALIKELVIVRGFNVHLNLEDEILTISWDLSLSESTQ